MATKTKSTRTTIKDGWQNVLTGRGTDKDKRNATTFSASADSITDYSTLCALYAYNGVTARVVEAFPDEMTRAWFCVKNDPERHVLSTLETMKARPQIRQALVWSELFGGGIVMMGVNDGQTDLSQPVNVNNIRSVMFLKPFDRHRVNFSTADMYTDPVQPKYGQVAVYNVSPIGLSPFRLHETRVLRFDGFTLPDDIKASNQGWGGSLVDRCFTQIRSLGGVFDNVELITEDFVQSVLTIKNLGDMIAGGQEADIRKRLDIMDLSRHVLNTILLDAEETYTKQSSSVAGLPDIMDRFVKWLSLVSKVPTAILLGEEPAGLNATGDNQLRRFYDMTTTKQEDMLVPELEKLCRYIFLSKDNNPYGGREPEDWKIELEKLWEPTEKEEKETEKLQAEIDDLYINNGTLMPEEVALSRFGEDVEDGSDDITLLTERIISNGQDPESDTTAPAGNTEPAGGTQEGAAGTGAVVPE